MLGRSLLFDTIYFREAVTKRRKETATSTSSLARSFGRWRVSLDGWIQIAFAHVRWHHSAGAGG
jgi:hypothetical protein